jgi:hypothetical protein
MYKSTNYYYADVQHKPTEFLYFEVTTNASILCYYTWREASILPGQIINWNGKAMFALELLFLNPTFEKINLKQSQLSSKVPLQYGSF